MIQENADPDVIKDMKNFFNKLVPMEKVIFIAQKERMICLHISNPL